MYTSGVADLTSSTLYVSKDLSLEDLLEKYTSKAQSNAKKITTFDLKIKLAKRAAEGADAEKPVGKKQKSADASGAGEEKEKKKKVKTADDAKK
jgi:hypothetical protein